MRPPALLPVACAVLVAVVTGGGLAVPEARADAPAPPAEPGPFHLMDLLVRHGIHDPNDEAWSAYGQITDIWNAKLGFHAPYTNYHGATQSLLPGPELAFTETATFFFGLGLWPGGELYVVPEIIAEQPFSHLAGIGGAVQDFELQKTGKPYPTPYLSRAYVRQTFGFGGGKVDKASDQQQLGRSYDARRLVLTLGNLSVLDVMDKNNVLGDPRRGFLNMGFMTHAAYDFAADARGYTWAGAVELYVDDWAFRFMRAIPPELPNQLALDFRFWRFYGDQVEIEHDHRILGRDGAIRVLGYRNMENMGRFDDASAAYTANPNKNAAACTGAGLFNYGSTDATAPDLCWVRKPNVKVGVGINIEQRILDDLGVFFRGMYSDGKTEVYAFTPSDRSLSFGAIGKGTTWHRPADTVGLGWTQAWISGDHARYLRMGGEDGFVGDGRLDWAPEYAVELFYSFNIANLAFFTADYQHLWNPGFNADRGPVDIFGGRLHVEL